MRYKYLRKAFPFLIGRIRTAEFVEYVQRKTAFPFLIGRIRTLLNPVFFSTSSIVFPFLIGRIRTIFLFQSTLSKSLLVSIPHR